MNAILTGAASGVSGYGIVTAISVFVAAFVLYFVAKKRGLYDDFAFEALIFTILPAMFFARLYYVIFSGVSQSIQWTVATFFGFNGGNGALSAIGAVIGGVIGLGALYATNRYLYRKDEKKYAHRNVTFSQTCDAVAVAAIFALGAGRWGDLIEGSYLGDIVENKAMQWFPIAVKMNDNWVFATFFYEFLWDMLAFGVMLYAYVGKKKSYDGFISALFFIFYGLGRLAIDGLRVGNLWLFEDVIKVDQVFGTAFLFVGIVLIASYIVRARSLNQQLFLFVADDELDDEFCGAALSRVNKPSLESLKPVREKVKFEDVAPEGEESVKNDLSDGENFGEDDISDEENFGEDDAPGGEETDEAEREEE